MWIFVAPTSQKANAAIVQKNRCFRARFLRCRKPPKKGRKCRFSVQEILNTLSWSVALFDVLHQVRRLTVKHFANLVEDINGQVLCRIVADCGNRRGTNSSSFCQIFLGHLSDCKHDFYLEFYHNRILPLGNMVLRIISRFSLFVNTKNEK